MDLGNVLGHLWIVPALPAAAAILLALGLPRRWSSAAGWVGTVAVGTAFLGVLAAAWSYMALSLGDGAKPTFVSWQIEWLRFQEDLVISMGTLVDPISLLLLGVVTGVSTLVHLYSIGYMKGDPGIKRYFASLNFFTFSMLGLVLAPNIVQMYVFWELVGVSSFLLIGFYFQKPSAVAAAKKAFIVTRFADLGFLLGVLILGYYGVQSFAVIAPGGGLQPFDFLYLTRPDVLGEFASGAGVFLGLGALSWAMLLLFMGAAGKSAMFPLHVWLPDAMEGPTPVSALIHAATMVVAGVYLVARMFPAFAAADVLMVVAVVGAFTSLFAAAIACVQHDIKRVLAYSTLSQLGYMMLALGVATALLPQGYAASMFHLFTHAFFKALLFLGAGAVIHAVHSNDARQMGGLAAKMPVTHATFLLATMAIAGFWPLAGFFSKDEILAAVWAGSHPLFSVVAFGVAGLTAFYMFRLYFLVFRGEARSDGGRKVHEAPPIMLLPLVVLGVFSVVAGWVPIVAFVSPAAATAGVPLIIPALATLMAVGGLALAYGLYGKGGAPVVSPRWGWLHSVLVNKFYVDEVYLFVTRQVIFRYIAAPIAWFDRHVVDGAVDLTGSATRGLGGLLKRMQTGQVQTYGTWVVGGVITVFLLLWVVRI